MNNLRVSIGIFFDEETDYVHTINLITAQNYKEMELICYLYEGIGISAYNILEIIRMHRTNNIKRVIIITDKKKIDFEKKIKKVQEQSTGKWIIFLKGNESLMSCDCIKKMVDTSIKYNKSILIKSVIKWKKIIIGFKGVGIKNNFDENNVIRKIALGYIFLLKNQCIEEVSRRERKNVEIKKINKFGVIHIRKHKQTKKERKKVFKEYKINCTNAIYLENFIDKIVNEIITKKEIISEINVAKNFICGKAKDGYWGLSQSDQGLLFYLDEIYKIQISCDVQHRKEKIKTLKARIEDNKESFIKILMLTQEYYLWSSLKSVYDQAKSDERFLIDLVYLPFFHNQKRLKAEEEIQYYLDAGYDIKKWNDYDMAEKSPDVVIVMKPYDSIPIEYRMDNLDKIVRRAIYIRYAPSVNFALDAKLIELLFTLPAYFVMWKCLAYTKVEKENAKHYAYQRGKEWLEIGHPRDDFSVEDFNENDKEYYDFLIEKSKGRKVLMWNTAPQLVVENEMEAYGSFLQLGENIIEIAKMNEKEIFLIWRPHPRFYEALMDEWGKEKTEDFFEKVREIKNIYIDEYKQYAPAMFCSDALISDTSSLIDLYIPMLKPILLTLPQNIEKDRLKKNFEDIVYLGSDYSNIKNFFDMVKMGEHKKICCQENYAKENYYSLTNSKSVAENLLDYIIEMMDREEKILFENREDRVGIINFE